MHVPQAVRRNSPDPRRRMAGVGLIEVLIAVTILAFGLLGIAAMQATTLRNSQSAAERSEAAIATNSILERMRANYNEAANGSYDLAALTCNAPTGTNLITNDQKAWIDSIHASLGATACGQIVGCGDDTCEIIVQWDDSRGTQVGAGVDASKTQKLVTETRL
jgi:type IV pilus assembly protein PilV